MPFGGGRLLPGTVRPILSRRNPKIGYGGPIAQIFHLRICAQITNENDFIDSSHIKPSWYEPNLYPGVGFEV
jgi:hypothetical protein